VLSKGIDLAGCKYVQLGFVLKIKMSKSDLPKLKHGRNAVNN